MNSITDAAAEQATVDEGPMQFERQGHARLLLTVSPTHKHFAMRAFAMQQVVAWMTILGLIVVHASQPILTADAIWRWGGAFVGSWLLRMLMIAPLYKLPPSRVAKSIALKSLPILSSLMACVFWFWTAVLFVGPDLTMRELVLFIGFLSLSISMTGMWPVMPATALTYHGSLWAGLSYALWTQGAATSTQLVVLNASVATIIWLNAFVSILQVNAQLARGVELDRALHELQKTNARLGALNVACKTLESRSEFFSEASHDFRQRLHSAKLWVASVIDATRGLTDAARPLERLGQELDALQVYLDQVLDFARIEAMDAGAQLSPTRIQSLFHKLDLNFERITERDGTELRFRRATAVIHTDAKMLLRLLENLVSNALRFTRKGVLVCARRRGPFLALEVWDQGPGIELGAQQRIFDAFHRGELGGRSAAHEGVGLGLAIVKRFADRLGYQVQIRSVVGRGTLFRVSIPAQFIEIPAPQAPPRRAAPSSPLSA